MNVTTLPPIDINRRVAQYVKLRDHIKALDDAHKEKIKPFKDTLEQLNGVLLAHLSALNSESVRTDSGTVYKTIKKSASLADVAAFWDYVVANNYWDLLDKKANVKAVEDFIEQHHAQPPGVNYTVVQVVGVRRA